MPGGRAHYSGLHVAGDIGLDQDATVAHRGLEPGILVEPGPMPDAGRVAPVHRLGDGLRARGLAGMDRDPQATIPGQVERRGMAPGRPARLAPGEIEAHHTVSPRRHRAPGDLQRDRRIVVAQRAVDDAGLDPEVALAPLEPAALRLNHLLQGKPPAGAQHRAVANLDVAYIVPGRVLHHFVGHPLQRLGGLQQLNGHLEAADVILQIPGGVDQHAPAEPVRIRGGELDPCAAGEVDHGLGAERAVQVHVELGLREPGEELTGQHRRLPGRPARSGPPGRSRRA